MLIIKFLSSHFSTLKQSNKLKFPSQLNIAERIYYYIGIFKCYIKYFSTSAYILNPGFNRVVLLLHVQLNYT